MQELGDVTEERVWKDDNDPLRMSAVVRFNMYEFIK